MSESDEGDAPKAQAVTPTPTLRFSDEPVQALAISLEEDEGTLGRREDNTYVVAAPSVSRVHARLTKQTGSVIVTDLGSSGGTRVNDEEITGPQALAHGDTVSFGQVTAAFEDPATAVGDADETTVFEVPEVQTGPELSPRQQQVIELIAEGMTNKEIGNELGITERTVKAYAQEIYGKLGVGNRAGAVAEALKHGLM